MDASLMVVEELRAELAEAWSLVKHNDKRLTDQLKINEGLSLRVAELVEKNRQLTEVINNLPGYI